MKQLILPFLLGIFVTISIAATTTTMMTIKPAIPKATYAYCGGGDNTVDFINSYSKKGWIVTNM